MGSDLDELYTLYREHLKRISSLWMQSTHQGLCDGSFHKRGEDAQAKFEAAVTQLMEKGIQLEKARHEVLELKSALDISRQTVEAKWKHLGQEEKQKEEEQAQKFKEFQKIKKLQEERDVFLKETIPVKERLRQAMEILDEKSEKLRNLENFHTLLADHCASEIISLKDQADEARVARSRCDRSGFDLKAEVMTHDIDPPRMEELERNVSGLKEALFNHRQWYEEELQTKLFRATQSKEIKHRLHLFRNQLNGRNEKPGGSEESVEEEGHGRRLSRRSEHFLVDGSPAVQAKEVERYLSQQFGMRVLADYTMLRRLKDEIGIQGLAYLVEKVRLQSTSPPSYNPRVSQQPLDWEEHRVQQALKNIANEYRENEENKRLLRAPGSSISGQPNASDTRPHQNQLSHPDKEDNNRNVYQRGGSSRTRPHQGMNMVGLGSPPIPTRSNTSSQVSSTIGSLDYTQDASFNPSTPSSQNSDARNSSLRKYNSLTRIKKFLKLQ